ncbi:XTP/dITP diphosphatase [Desulfohalovibrio reitneri]|uniref:XTP/dITP diphosphatase n=1 Tax=Desulfohalovibrio reitneri TaxID=1307759 RepID=UPI0004A73283|nr:XTP/dITP diphosphatase [Desulfohalovibrio reitneri]
MSRIVLATRNKGKISELRDLLSGSRIEVLSLDDFPGAPEVAEDGETFEENALKKAREMSAYTGLAAVADDSGLEVDALGGAPGVHSARYAGEQGDDEANNAKLLRELSGVPEQERAARFVCVMAAAAPNGAEALARGEWEGRIAFQPQGEGGFGYDPLFIDPELGKASAELAPGEKNARSHRGRALNLLLETWADFWKRAGQQD